MLQSLRRSKTPGETILSSLGARSGALRTSTTAAAAANSSSASCVDTSNHCLVGREERTGSGTECAPLLCSPAYKDLCVPLMEDHLSISRSPLQRYEQQQQQSRTRRRALARASNSEPRSLLRSSSDKCLYRTRSAVGAPVPSRDELWQQPDSPAAAAAAAAAVDGVEGGKSVALLVGPSPAAEGSLDEKRLLGGCQLSLEGASELLCCALPRGDSSSIAVSLQQPLLSMPFSVASECGDSASPTTSLPASHTASQLAARGAGGAAWGLRERMRACATWFSGRNNAQEDARAEREEGSTGFGWSSVRLGDSLFAAAGSRGGGTISSSPLPSRSYLGDRASSDRPQFGRQSSLSLLASLPQRPRKFSVVEISGGCCHRREVQTPELLRMVHLHNKKQELSDTKVGALKLRDLRQVVSPSGDGRPSIEVRRNCILVNMPNIRCILLYSKVLLLPPNRLSPFAEAAARGHKSSRSIQLSDTGLVEDEGNCTESLDQQYEMLISKLLHLSDLKRSGPAEFAALEALLVHVCDALIAELAPLKAAADRLLQYFHEQPSSTRRLRQISELKRRLNSSKEKACGVERAIRELLNEEEDMLRLEVSKFWGHDELWDNPPKTPEAEDAEILLECYEQEVEAIYQANTHCLYRCLCLGLLPRRLFLFVSLLIVMPLRLPFRVRSGLLGWLPLAWLVFTFAVVSPCLSASLTAQVIVRTEDALDDALQLMELHLASTRNAFLKMEIALDIVSAFFGFIAAAAGIFGMNIRSGWEDKVNIFWGVLTASSVASLAVLASVYYWFKRQKL
ncbi:hypothetical protein Esti_000589 [Eimeria stiedai]